jgi:hypothetical protein
MPANQRELDNFHQFATSALANDGRQQELEDLLQAWRERDEESETLDSIRRGVDDVECGRVSDLDEVDAKIRDEFGFPARTR